MEEIPEAAFQDILNELKRRPLETNHYRDICGIGKSQAFGVVNKRCRPPDYSRQNWLRPYLYKLLLDFGARFCPIPFNAITVNQNYRAAPHYDKHNSGVSMVVAFGDYTGGELELLEGERKGVYNVRHRPIVDNFSTVLHAVREFQGERYSLVFYTFEHPAWKVELPPPSVREVGGKWVFFRGEEKCSGLPHPLRGFKRPEKQKEISGKDLAQK